MNKTLLAFAFAVGLPLCAYAAETIVTQSHTSFDSEALTVSAGDTVVFKNADDVTHNIQVMNGEGDIEDKGLQKPGEDIRQVFAKPGDYKIRCAIHPRMKMKVTVR